MTVVVGVKVFDGIVIAADSATTLYLPNGDKQVYNNADKVFHLHRDLPIGMATWGGGQIESASISTLAKDLRRRLMGRSDSHADWKLRDDYTIEQVAGRVVDLMHDELFSHAPAPLPQGQETYFLVAGYSAGARHSEVWMVNLADPTVRPVPQLYWDQTMVGWTAHGQPEAVGRLLNGASPSLRATVAGAVCDAVRPTIEAAFDGVRTQMAYGPMPLADAIDLARFCVELTEGFVKFDLGSNTVGGPIDVAAISRHEGFKWVQRKHYYPADLNPRRPHEHDQ